MSTPYERKNHYNACGNIVWAHSTITHEDRIKQKDRRPVVLWFTKFSNSGKSTIANAVENQLIQLGKHSYLLDGDNSRHGLNKLGYLEGKK